MKVLYLTNGFPYPLTSGYLRHYFFIRELARLHQVTLLSVVRPTFTPEHAEAMRPYTEEVLTFVAEAKGGSRRRKVVKRLQSSLFGDTEFRRMRSALERLLEQRQYDVMVLSGKPCYQAIAGLRLPPIVADMCDATTMRLQGQRQFVGRMRRAVLWLDCQKVRRAERAILNRAAHTVFASARDRHATVGGALSTASVLPNGVDLDFWHRRWSHLGVDTLVFTGAMNYSPNVDAALYLLDEIFPAVKRAIPGARLLIVGHSPTPALQRAGQQPGVTVTGYVDDVRPYLEQATLFVAPVRFGSGIQNKLLEALSMEVPTLASPIASDGLKTEGGDVPPLNVASTAEDYVQTIVEQLIRRRSAPVPMALGRQYVERHFSWGHSGKRLNEILHDVVSRQSSPQWAKGSN
jgi:polysaccharide biosynthesis protein PslH